MRHFIMTPVILLTGVQLFSCSSDDPVPDSSSTVGGNTGFQTSASGVTGSEASSTTGASVTGATGGALGATGATGAATTAAVASTTAGASTSTTGGASVATATNGAATTGAATTGAATTGAATTTTTGAATTGGASTTGGATAGCDAADITPSGADPNLSFFVTSWHHMQLLSGSNDGFGGDLRYKGASTGLQGADAICQEIACRVGFGHRTWKAFLSTSTEDARDRIGPGPWYDYAGNLVANDVGGLLSGDRQPGGCCEDGTYDELGIFHDGTTDVNNDGIEDDDHDTMTASNDDGTYAGFSCDDWTSTTTPVPDSGSGNNGGNPVGGGPGGLRGGIMLGHSWPAGSGQSWVTSHGGHGCAAGTNFIQNGAGDSTTVGGGGGYGGFYCFALAQ